MKYMFSDIENKKILDFHDLCHATLSWPSNVSVEYDENNIWYWIEMNHIYNCKLWSEEDKARRIDVDDSDIAQNKRNIDVLNQNRNDAIEHMDEIILERLSEIEIQKDAWHNSETVGSIIDRLSIVSLKIFHMGIQVDRVDIDLDQKNTSKIKKNLLVMQRNDLILCFNQLLKTASTGNSFYKIYRQFKMYNDPKMNPYLSGLL